MICRRNNTNHAHLPSSHGRMSSQTSNTSTTPPDAPIVRSVQVKRREALTAIAGIAASVVVADTGNATESLVPRSRRVRSPQRCRLPIHPYQHESFSPPLYAISLPSQSVTPTDSLQRQIDRAADGNADQVNTAGKRFRPSRARLEIDHCSVTDLVLDLYPDGAWMMSLKASQNRMSDSLPQSTYPEHIALLRNEFTVGAYLLASAILPRTETQGTTLNATSAYDRLDEGLVTVPPPELGNLVVDHVRPASFWVQRHRPRVKFWRDRLPSAMMSQDAMPLYGKLPQYTQVQSVLFEFYYKLDPVSSAGQSIRRLDGR